MDLDSVTYEDWQRVGASYYSRRELYPIDWAARGVNLAFMRVCAAPAGGPIAALRDDRKLVLYVGSLAKPDIQLFSAAGAALGRVLWDKGRVVALGWGPEEQLVVVDDRGQVHVYGVRGGSVLQQASLGAECEQEGVAEAVVFPTGVLAMSPLRHLWCIPRMDEPRVQRLPAPCGTDSTVHCMAAIPPQVSASGALEVVVAVDNTVRLVDSSEVVGTTVFEGPILRLAPSPCGKYVGGYGQDGTVHVWTADIADVVTRVGVSETSESFVEAGLPSANSNGQQQQQQHSVPQTPPDQMAWCGSDGLVLFWEFCSGLLLVTLGGQWRWWEADPGAALACSDVDGLRLLTPTSHQLLRRVPEPLVEVLEIGSTSPGALLYDARRLFDAQDARATGELLELLREGQLPGAATACLQAAAAELDPHKQEALMRASCYGRAFCALEPAAASRAGAGAPTSAAALAQDRAERREPHEISRRLRVINALQDPEVGIPLTLPQLETEGLARLVGRLVGRRHYLLAVRIAEALGVPTEQVLVRWACDKISAAAGSTPDEQLLAALQAKLAGRPGVKYARVAAHAAAAGRRGLAAALLEREPCAGDQVPLLLELGEDDRALDRAVESGDSDLVFEVVHAMWRRLGRVSQAPVDQPHHRPTPASQRFWAAVARRPAALAFFAKYHRHSNPGLLLELYDALGRHEAAAELQLELAQEMIAAGRGYTETQVQRRLAQAKDEYTRAGATDKSRDHKWEAGAVVQLARLREVQLDLQEASRREGFVGLSVADTLRQCFKLGLRDQAAKLAKDFKVPEKQFVLLQIWTFAGVHDWAQLQHMAGKLDRRAPVTIEHFVAAARSHGAPQEVLRWLIDQVSGDNALMRKAQLYSNIGMHSQAKLLAEQAEQQGAGGVLGSLRGAVGGGGVLGSLMGRVAPGTGSGNAAGGR